MRENKFRGKRVDNGELVFGYYFKTPLTDEETGSKPEDGWFFLTGRERHCISQNNCVYEVIPETVGQYTVLKDIDEQEAYEDDILWDDEDYFVIEFVNGCFAAILKDGTTDEIHPLFDILGQSRIIGNIHDNPELLKAGETT